LKEQQLCQQSQQFSLLVPLTPLMQLQFNHFKRQLQVMGFGYRPGLVRIDMFESSPLPLPPPVFNFNAQNYYVLPSQDLQPVHPRTELGGPWASKSVAGCAVTATA
jgi:hypothetical protein